MKFNPLKKYLLIAVICASPFFSGAWGLLGHRIVGQIAQSYLTPKAQAEISKILGHNNLAMSANWMDFVKSDTTSRYKYLSTWHYVDIEGGLSDAGVLAFLAADTVVDAYTKINFMVKELKNKNLEADKKLLYLRALIHIVGDIHQPLHVGHPEDLGGNKIKVMWFNDQSNLHRVWDDDLISSQKLSYTEYASSINFVTPEQKKIWQSQPLSQWILESYQDAQKIYAGVKPDDKLSFRYGYDFIEMANRDLLKGGVRLAGLLNSIFAPQPSSKKPKK